MKTSPFLYALMPSLLLLISCVNTHQNNCTEIFKTTYISIENADLDDFYTLRTSTKDTFRCNYPEGNNYPVLNDQYQKKLVNNKDSFNFVGIINDSIVLVEPFVFSADDCHIHYISGNQNRSL
ncbi:MAG: Unknown protein [uncultured Aureispira sp.]|uniref:Lipoprotein n=1 Tax=uncultured Aureispira sp. TaxID=1331704 RepID=A0A6S6TWJ8_9BACT|nr:MAG: Unknown protein [uncultured Aureispira sp.]